MGSRFGDVRWGNPDGMWPAICTPVASPPSRPIKIVAMAMTTSAASSRPSAAIGPSGSKPARSRVGVPLGTGAADKSGALQRLIYITSNLEFVFSFRDDVENCSDALPHASRGSKEQSNAYPPIDRVLDPPWFASLYRSHMGTER